MPKSHKHKERTVIIQGPPGPPGPSGASDPTALSLLWREYPNNPVYNPFPVVVSGYSPCVLARMDRFAGYGSNYEYKMWMQWINGTIGLAHSVDGVNWVAEGATNLPVGAAGHPCVVFDPNGFGGGTYHYKIWYWTLAPSSNGNPTPSASPNAVHYAESNDGLNWFNDQAITQDPAAPLVDGVSPGFFYQLYGPGYVGYNPQASSSPGKPTTYPYYMYYDSASEGFGPGSSVEAISLAYSSDGLYWHHYGIAPVAIPLGTVAFTWDGSHMFRPSIVIDDQGLWHMFYSGSNINYTDGTVYAHGLGEMISRDQGVTWSPLWTNPIFYYDNGVQWRNARSYSPSVLYQAYSSSGGKKQWKMWFAGGQGTSSGKLQGVGYATIL